MKECNINRISVKWLKELMNAMKELFEVEKVPEIKCYFCNSSSWVDLGPIDGANNFCLERYQCLDCGDFFDVEFDFEGEVVAIISPYDKK